MELMEFKNLPYRLLSENELIHRYVADDQGVPRIFRGAVSKITEYPRIVYEFFEDSLEIYLEFQASSQLAEALEVEEVVQTIFQNRIAVKEHSRYLMRLANNSQSTCCRFVTAQDCFQRMLKFELVETAYSKMAEPNPIAALQAFVKVEFPEAIIAGSEDLGMEYLGNPMFVLRPLRVNSTNEAENSSWFWKDVRIGVDVFCQNELDEVFIADSLLNSLKVVGELELADGSPMRLLKAYLKDDQGRKEKGLLRLDFRYGVLRPIPEEPAIRNIGMDYQFQS